MGSGNCAQCGRSGWRHPVGQALVEVAERKWQWGAGWSKGPGRLSPASGRDGRPERPSPGWLTAQGGGGRESVVKPGRGE
jgi:hypothetical protein